VTVAQAIRVAWTIVSGALFESVVFGVAVLPAFVAWQWAFTRLPVWWPGWFAPAVVAMTVVPAYVVFAVALAALSAFGTRLLGWRTPPPGEWALRDYEWPVLDWARYMASTHTVRIFVGTFFRSTILWVWYFRWNGATIGHGVYVNSLFISDHNLLTFGDGVVVGDGVHLSGHTVERGRLKTGRVCLGQHVTLGLGSIIGIDVTIGEGTQVGALSVVPKHSSLDSHAVYVGAPAARLEPS
jgi:acetyltransferase-like isoleucine patch superfamily enzyme